MNHVTKLSISVCSQSTITIIMNIRCVSNVPNCITIIITFFNSNYVYSLAIICDCFTNGYCCGYNLHNLAMYVLCYAILMQRIKFSLVKQMLLLKQFALLLCHV